jgi:catechol 2,3-dioxygenase-like lactoylglutathione lyase family enzyme
LTAARGLHHLAILVSDLAAAERFYCRTLGLAVLRRWPAAEGSGERSIWVDSGDGSFLALEVIAAGRARDRADDGEGDDEGAGDQPGLHLVALRIPAAERASWEQRLAQAGVEVYRRTAFTLYVRDPEGNRVGLSHFPEPAAPPAEKDD